MGIFSTVSEVFKNRKNFDRWEEKQRLEQAQREQLYQNNQYTEEEIENARALGENIIGAIDVMDNHSESVAENVETATEPIVGIAPVLGTGAASFATAKYMIDPAYKKINDIVQAELSTDAAQELYRKIQDSFGSKGSYFRLDSKRCIKKIKDPDLKKQAEQFYKNLSKKTSIYKKSFWAAGAIVLASLLTSFMGSIILATKMQVNSSKVARFQARRQLEDPKYFVNYTPEQIAQAQADMEEAKRQEKQQKGLFKKKSKDDDGKPKLRQGFFGSLFGLFRDHKAYKEAKKLDTDESKIVTRELTQGELIQAEKDKEVIQRTVRLINNEAEKNSENMETAANVIIGGTPLLGMAVGSLTSWILNKTKIIDKVIDKAVDKNASEITKKYLADYKAASANKKLKGITGLAAKATPYLQYVQSMLDDLTNSQAVVNGVRQKPKISEYFKRGTTAVMTSAKGRNWIFGLIGSFVTGIAGLILGLKLQKSAARAGRYTAKRELEKDPRNFIGYTQEEYNEVQDVEPVKKESRFKEAALFIPRVLKQYYEYSKYKKGEFKKKEEFRKYLRKQEVSEQQLSEARNLQRKVFNTFEKVDDNSQKYSESMEAAIDIAQPFVIFGGYIAAAIPIVAAIAGLIKVKENPAKIIDKITSWMKNGSKVMNSKLTKKYLNGVADNVSAKTAEFTVEHKPIAHLLKGIDLQKDKKLDILRKLFENLKLSPEELRKLPPEEVEVQIRKAYYQLSNLQAQGNKYVSDLNINGQMPKLDIDKYLQVILKMPTDLKIDALDVILNPKNIKNISKENYTQILKLLGGDFEKSKTFVNDLIKKIPTQEIKEYINKLADVQDLEKFIDKTTIEELTSLLNKLENQEKLADEIVNAATSQETLIKLTEGLSKISAELKAIPDKVKNNKEVQALMQEEIEMPATVLIALRKLAKTAENPKNYEQTLEEVQALLINSNGAEHKVKTTINKMLNEGKASVNKLKTNLKEFVPNFLESKASVNKLNINLKEFVPDFLKEPSKCISTLKEVVEKSTPESFSKIVSEIPYLKSIKDLDKDMAIKILGNLEKSINNIPKAELKKIMDSMVKEFNKNPDEFIKLLSSGRIGEIFMTPQLQKALAVAGISIPMFTLVITYAIESWLAGLQLRAGRLGVMKSLEDLEDPRYYANIEPEAV